MILLRFFKFYGYEFKPEKYAIDIRSGFEPFPLREKALQQIN
jgi:hypothetical protein